MTRSNCTALWMVIKLTQFYLLLLVSSSVPRLQNRLGFGAARGRHSIITCPPLAAGISFLTGFNLKSGAWTGRGEDRMESELQHRHWHRQESGTLLTYYTLCSLLIWSDFLMVLLDLTWDFIVKCKFGNKKYIFSNLKIHKNQQYVECWFI